MKQLLFFLLLLLPFSIAAQDDSLKILNELASADVDQNPRASLSYSRQAENLFWNSADSVSQSSAETYYNMGLAYYVLGYYSPSIINNLRSKQICEKIGYDFYTMKNCRALGTTYLLLGNYPNALSYYLTGLKYAEKSGNKKEMAAFYNMIGVTYFDQKDYEHAIKYYSSSAAIYSELSNQHVLAAVYNNLGLTYGAFNKPDSALLYFHKSENIYELTNDKMGLSTCFANIADEEMKKENTEEALNYYTRSLNLKNEIGDKQGASAANYSVGLVYLEKYRTSKNADDLKKAETHLLQSLATATQLGEQSQIMQCDNALSDVYALKGDYKSAYTYTKSYMAIRDSMLNAETSEKMMKIEMQYDFEKKMMQNEYEMKIKQLMMDAEEKKKR